MICWVSVFTLLVLVLCLECNVLVWFETGLVPGGMLEWHCVMRMHRSEKEKYLLGNISQMVDPLASASVRRRHTRARSRHESCLSRQLSQTTNDDLDLTRIIMGRAATRYLLRVSVL